MSHFTHTTPADKVSADYIVVVSNDDDYQGGFHHFSDKVNRKLRAGYQLHGPPFTLNHTICQAMVRPEGPQHSGDTTLFFKHHGADNIGMV